MEDNEIWDTAIFNWPWGFTKGSSARNNAVLLTSDVGRGHFTRRNAVHGLFNGMGPCGDTAPTGFTTETDIYDNVLYEHTDDVLEPRATAPTCASGTTGFATSTWRSRSRRPRRSRSSSTAKP